MAVTVMWAVLILSAAAVLRCCMKGGRRISSLFYMSAPGLAALALLNLTSQYTGLAVPVNIYNLTTAVFLGLPGVAGIAASGCLR